MTGSSILIASTKFDGSPHYEYEAELLGCDGPVIVCRVHAGVPWTGYRGSGLVRYESTALFFTDRWYNTQHFHEPYGEVQRRSYTNIGLPAVLEDGVLRWVDLDIDVMEDLDRTWVDDEDEFEEHRARMGYPDDIVAGVLAARDEVLRLVSSGTFPFDRASHVPPLVG